MALIQVEVVVAVISIFVVTGLVWLIGKVSPFRICAICAGVSLTWLWMLFARMLGYNIDMVVPAVLMGGSVVGAAYQMEARLPVNRSPFLFKSLVIPLGFLTALYLLSLQWIGFVVLMICLVVIAGLFFVDVSGGQLEVKHDNERVMELKRKMDKCC